VLEAIAKRKAHAAENGFFRHGEHRSRVAVDATYEVFDGFFELRFRDEAIDHAQVESAFGGDGFTGEDKLESDFGPDKKRQNRGGKRRKNTDADFGLGEARFGSGNHKVTESGQLRAATDGRTIYDADNGEIEISLETIPTIEIGMA